MRRETGKRQTVEVRHSEGVANRTGPEGYFDMYGDVEVINKRVSESQFTPLHNAVGLLHRLITSCCRHSRPGVRGSYVELGAEICAHRDHRQQLNLD